jgi:hypothetical protein
MAVNHFAVTSNQTRNLETKFTDTAAHAIHGHVVLAWVPGVKDQLIDWQHLDFHRYFSWHHNKPFSGRFGRKGRGERLFNRQWVYF